MNVTEPARPLNQILHALARSLPTYLHSARPWADESEEPIRQALATLAEDQRRYAQWLAGEIVRLGGHPLPGTYPHEFWDLNDLDARYLLGRVVERHSCDVELIRHCCRALPEPSPLRDLADEILGNAQGHLEVLEELVGRK